MTDSIPYALALVAVAAAGWDGWRRLLSARAAEREADRAIATRQLSVEFEFEAMKRNFLLLDEKTKKGLENLAESTDLAVKKIEGQLAADEFKKMNTQAGRRIG